MLKEITGVQVYDSNRKWVNPYAAVPSMHFGYSFLFATGLVSIVKNKKFGKFGFLAYIYPSCMLLSVLVTGNHFVFDALAALIVILSSLGIVFLISKLVYRSTKLGKLEDDCFELEVIEDIKYEMLEFDEEQGFVCKDHALSVSPKLRLSSNDRLESVRTESQKDSFIKAS